MNVALKAQGLCRSYGEGEAKIRVLDDFSMELEKGAFEVLMGPSGSGKSTFLHVAAGLLGADAGSVVIGEDDVTKMSDSEAACFRRRHVGLVFQNFNLIDELTVAENVVLPVKLDHGKIDGERLQKLLERLGIADHASRKVSEFSGGERQRIAIARALFAKPDVILADEPTGNLDIANAKALCELLAAVNKDDGVAILLVTHDPVVAAAARKVHFLKSGKIAASFETNNDPAEISKRYIETYGGAIK